MYNISLSRTVISDSRITDASQNVSLSKIQAHLSHADRNTPVLPHRGLAKKRGGIGFWEPSTLVRTQLTSDRCELVTERAGGRRRVSVHAEYSDRATRGGNTYGSQERSPRSSRSSFRDRRPQRPTREPYPYQRQSEIIPINEHQKQCYGCGAVVQKRDQQVAGYVDPEQYSLKQKHNQLGRVLCKRCHELQNGAMLNAVSGQAQAPRHAKGLVTPDELRDQLKPLRQKKALVLKVIDIMDFNGSFMNRIRDLIGSNPVFLIVTKVDLLPKGTQEGAIEQWVLDRALKRRLNVAGVLLVSGRTGDGVKQLVSKVLSERRGRDVYVIGAANVGKSTFVQSFLDAMQERDFSLADVARRMPTASAMPGTTLGTIAIEAFGERKSCLYDTPGVLIEHRMSAILLPHELKHLIGRGRMKPYAPPWQLKLDHQEEEGEAVGSGGQQKGIEGVSYMWGSLVRVDVIKAPPSAALGFLGPKDISLEVMPTPSDENESHDGLLSISAEGEKALVGADTVAAVGGLRVARELVIPVTSSGMVRPLVDVVPSGLGGWIGVFAEHDYEDDQEIQLRIWAPSGIEVFVRPALPVEWHAGKLFQKRAEGDMRKTGLSRMMYNYWAPGNQLP